MKNFEELAKGMTSSEILNLYRNFYFREGNNNERGLVANAINEILPKFTEYQQLEEQGLLSQKQQSPQYVIIDKVNEFGYASGKYADMFNMTCPEHATVFTNKSVADKIALSLNLSRNYHLEVMEYSKALLYIIQNTAKKAKSDATDNVTNNRMWTILYSIDKLIEISDK